MEGGRGTPGGRLRPLLAITVIVSRPTGEAAALAGAAEGLWLEGVGGC